MDGELFGRWLLALARRVCALHQRRHRMLVRLRPLLRGAPRRLLHLHLPLCQRRLVMPNDLLPWRCAMRSAAALQR